jgi:hypothetical protein
MPPPVTSLTEMAAALADLFPLIHDERHRLAQQQLRHEPGEHTISPGGPE